MATLKKSLRGLLCFGLILVMAAAIAGCAQQSTQQPTQQFEGKGDSETDSVIADNKPTIGEITDPLELERLWQEYIYDAIATIGNTEVFNSAQEIDPVGVAQYCWKKYYEENGTANLQTDSEDSTEFLFPLADALKYAERYFNLKTLDVSKVPDYYYIPEKLAFTFTKYSEKPKPSFRERNAWDVHLSKVTRSEDGTLTVELDKMSFYVRDLIGSMHTYTLKERTDGSLYFVAGFTEYIDNDLATLTGDVKEFPTIAGFDGNLQDVDMVGELEGKLLLSYTPYVQDQSPALMLLNPDNMKIEKQVDLKDRIESIDVSFKGGKLFVRFKDKVVIYDGNLETEHEVILPELITAKMDREPRHDLYGYALVFFGGYDISSDLSKIVYCDEIGVKLITLEDGKEKLLAETVQPESLIASQPSQPSRGVPLGPSYHFSPRFVADDRKVLTTLTGYEATSGFTFCDLEKGSTTLIRLMTDGDSTTSTIRYDTGLLFVNQYTNKYWWDSSLDDSVKDTDQLTEGYRTLFLDFYTGKVRTFELDDPGDTGYIRPANQCYVGQNYAAFVTSKLLDKTVIEDDVHYLNRVNVRTLDLEQELISIAIADPHILGVLADGRIVFWYELNPAEKGICVTPARDIFQR